MVFADTEFADFFAKIAKDTPKVRQTLIFDGPAAQGQSRVEPLLAKHAVAPPELKEPAGEPMTMIYTSGTTGKPKGAVRSSLGNPQQSAALWAEIGYVADDVYITTGPLYHSGPGGFLADRASPRQHRRPPTQVRRRRLAAPRPNLWRHDDVRGADAHPPHLPTARRRLQTL